MLRSLSLCFIASLCTSALCKLTNYTIDDTSPAVIYTSNITLHCDPNTCEPQWTNQTWNGTSTVTNQPILVSFTGSEVYVFLEASAGVIFNLDGYDVSLWNDPQPSDIIRLAYSNTSMPSGAHTLLISPANPVSLIEFDYLVYTVDIAVKQVHVAAIAGGVVGGVAFVGILAVAAILLRRRDRRRKVVVRGIPLGEDDTIKLRKLSTEKA
ncbi:hypothetical protein R3P38DRAFT_3271221 [Favolaschia claudopus]|uniref:Uncharacterized protein n=1 Tax=Favolaschia claudopus TaxID=2862362 RepID=A0AAW0B9T5_9AGAR